MESSTGGFRAPLQQCETQELISDVLRDGVLDIGLEQDEVDLARIVLDLEFSHEVIHFWPLPGPGSVPA